MRETSTIDLIPAFTLVAALAACGGGDGGAATPDMTGVTGSGTLASPYAMPIEVQGNGSQGIDDYLTSGKFWSLRRQDEARLGGAVIGKIVYDSRADNWYITVGSTERRLTPDGAAYSCKTCAVASGLNFSLYGAGDPAVAEYGTFATLTVGGGPDSITVFHTGLRTPTAQLPPGSATYTGAYEGYLSLAFSGTAAPSFVPMGGRATMTADFGINKTVLLDAPEVTAIADGLSATYAMTGSGDIVDNTYNATVSAVVGIVYDDGTTIINGSGTVPGLMDGAFYGPAATETAASIAVNGTIPVTNTSGVDPISVEFVGGFSGVKTP